MNTLPHVAPSKKTFSMRDATPRKKTFLDGTPQKVNLTAQRWTQTKHHKCKEGAQKKAQAPCSDREADRCSAQARGNTVAVHHSKPHSGSIPQCLPDLLFGEGSRVKKSVAPYYNTQAR